MYNKGDLYRIKFFDHSIGSKEPIECEVVGWIIKEDKIQVLITFWRLNNGCDDLKKDNIEPVSIIKSTIIKSRRLKRDL